MPQTIDMRETLIGALVTCSSVVKLIFLMLVIDFMCFFTYMYENISIAVAVILPFKRESYLCY